MITWVSNAYCQQLIQDITNDLDGVTTGLVADRISDEQTTASKGRLTADVWVVVLQIRKGATTNEFVQNMPCEVQLKMNLSITSGFATPLKSKDPRVDSANLINA